MRVTKNSTPNSGMRKNRCNTTCGKIEIQKFSAKFACRGAAKHNDIRDFYG